jgi:hypothetical protein
LFASQLLLSPPTNPDKNDYPMDEVVIIAEVITSRRGCRTQSLPAIKINIFLSYISTEK